MVSKMFERLYLDFFDYLKSIMCLIVTTSIQLLTDFQLFPTVIFFPSVIVTENTCYMCWQTIKYLIFKLP